MAEAPANLYNSQFYDDQAARSRLSASKIVGLIVELLQPKSVLDVGCGVGTWCAEFRAAGVPVVHGVDGPWIDKSRLEIPAEDFFEFDFGTEPTPFRNPTARPHYDLVVTFEFLEHVAAPKADALVEFLSGFGDAVVAGVAIPGQGGTHHVNEQWPGYWIERFAKNGLSPYDFLRLAVWTLQGVEPWYLQNAIGYFRHGPPQQVRDFAEAAVLKTLTHPAALVHPKLYYMKMNQILRLSRRVQEQQSKAQAQK
jgi:SAM-dependent methyltransferase